MKKTLLLILIIAVLFGSLIVCCFDGNGQLAYAENEVEQATADGNGENSNDEDGDGLDDYFGLPAELHAELNGNLGLTFVSGGRQVYLFSCIISGTPVGVQLGGYYFSGSGIEVIAEVYTSDALTIDFRINAKKDDLTDEQLAARDKLIDLFIRISQMIDEVDDCASTAYDGSESVAGKQSDISKYNSACQGDEVEISRYTYEMLQYARDMYNATSGAFNPAVYRLVDLWGFSSRIYSYGKFGLAYDRPVTKSEFVKYGYPLPEQKYVEAFSKPEFTDFSENAVQLRKGNDGTYYVKKNVAPAVVDGVKFEQWLDLGGIAKGFVVDTARAYVKELGIDRFYVNAGSSSIVYGDDVAVKFEDEKTVIEGKNAVIGMVDSFDPDSAFLPQILFGVEVGKSSISTSGQNIRKYEVDGVEYAHILDGAKGAPAQTGVRSVMVVVPEEMGQYWATMGDCLTTALTVMGRDGIIKFANSDFAKENKIKFAVQYETLDGKKQLLSNFDPNDLYGIGADYDKFGWALLVDKDGNYYYNPDADFANPQKAYTVWLAVLGSVLGVGMVALIVYHFVRGRKRVAQNVLSAKKDKPFKVLDVMLYLVVVLLILVLLYVFVFDTEDAQVRMITVVDMESGETLFMYNAVRNEYLANDDNRNGWKIAVEETDDGVEVTLTREIGGEEHFNTLKIVSGRNPSVKMVNSACGYHQDCVRNFPTVSRSGGTIVCSPNRLKILTA